MNHITKEQITGVRQFFLHPRPTYTNREPAPRVSRREKGTESE
jgi:hypothetical protein